MWSVKHENSNVYGRQSKSDLSNTLQEVNVANWKSPKDKSYTGAREDPKSPLDVGIS